MGYVLPPLHNKDGMFLGYNRLAKLSRRANDSCIRKFPLRCSASWCKYTFGYCKGNRKSTRSRVELNLLLTFKQFTIAVIRRQETNKRSLTFPESRPFRIIAAAVNWRKILAMNCSAHYWIVLLQPHIDPQFTSDWFAPETNDCLICFFRRVTDSVHGMQFQSG